MIKDNNLEQSVQSLERQWDKEIQVKKCAECEYRFNHNYEEPCKNCKPDGKKEKCNG